MSLDMFVFATHLREALDVSVVVGAQYFVVCGADLIHATRVDLKDNLLAGI